MKIWMAGLSTSHTGGNGYVLGIIEAKHPLLLVSFIDSVGKDTLTVTSLEHRARSKPVSQRRGQSMKQKRKP